MALGESHLISALVGFLVKLTIFTDGKLTSYHLLTIFTSSHALLVSYLCAVLSHSSRVRLFATPWTVPRQAPLSMGFPRQEYWSGLPFPSPGDLPNPGIEPRSPASLQCEMPPTESPQK